MHFAHVHISKSLLTKLLPVVILFGLILLSGRPFDTPLVQADAQSLLQVPNYIFPNEVLAHGELGGGTANVISDLSGVRGDLVMRSFVSAWLSLSTTANGGASVSSDDVFVGFGVLPPDGSVTYHGSYTQAGQNITVLAQYDFNAWLWNTSNTILRIIPGVPPLSSSALSETLIALAELNSIRNAATELSAIDGWPSVPGHVWEAANDLLELVTISEQTAALQAILERVGFSLTEDILKDVFTLTNIYEELKQISSTVVFFIVAPDGASVVFEAQYLGIPPPPIPPPEPPTDPCIPSATFIADVTYPDGSALSPGQSFNKTWRLQNTGTCTWENYSLAFVSGVQMGGPSSVPVPTTDREDTVDITVPLVAPQNGGTYQGNWDLRDKQGVRVEVCVSSGCGNVWVIISVPYGPPPTPPPPGQSGDIDVLEVQYPSVVTPGQTFRPKITVKVNQGQLLESRGDLLRNTDGNLYGAWPHVAVVGTVNPGETYTFEFYEDNPITAPSGEGTYENKWRVWRAGTWAGPEITIRFDVRIGGGKRPEPPTLTSPPNWSVSRDGSTPQLCASAPGGLEYFFKIFEGHQTPDSSWISSNCWTPPTLGPYTFRWHVKVKDSSSGLESDWSESWNFSIDSQELTMDDFLFSPSSPSTANEVRVYTCVKGFGGIGLGLKIEANTATDGSANGEWQWIHPLGTFCYNRDDPSTWPNWGTLPQADGTHLIRATGFGPGDRTIVKEALYVLGRRPPPSPQHLTPEPDGWANSQIVTFTWLPALRATSYQLLVATTPPTSENPLCNATLGADATSYTCTFEQSYPQLYAEVFAINEFGSSGGWWTFGIDTSLPSASVNALPDPTPETKFTVSWSGSDDTSGIRWYNIQYRDGNRPESVWVDWKTSTTETASLFSGQPGHTYYFRAQAMDNANNWEDYAGGDGDTHTTIDLIDLREETPWWNTDYAGKRNLVILNNDPQPLPTGYPMHLHFDATTNPSASDIYNASLSSTKGDDVRLVYQDQTELPRYIRTFTPEQIDIWFNLQAPLDPSPTTDSTNYQLYYGNANAANPPGTINDVIPPPMDGNALAIWHFQEGSGSSISDSSGNGHTGIASNMGWTTGKFGPAGDFNGTNSVVNAGNSPAFNVSNITLEAWVYPTNVTGGEQTILRKARSPSDGGLTYDFQILEERVYLRLNGSNGFVRSNTRLQNNRWYHITGTYDGSEIKVYINGILDNTAPYTVPLESGSSTNLYIGGDGQNNNKWFFGHIQNVRFSNIARTSFPYGLFGNITSEPSLAAGEGRTPPPPGSPDLAVLNVTTFLNPDGSTLVEAVVQNNGSRSTQNGFFNDLYLDHQPTGPGDFIGSIKTWVASPLDAGQTITLTTLLTFPSEISKLKGPDAITSIPQETNHTLYVQADSTGALAPFSDLQKTISDPVNVCVASDDDFEPDDGVELANEVTADGLAQTHNIRIPGDQDWSFFTAKNSVTYTIATASLGPNADTVLSLYAPDGTTLLDSSDDSGESLASQIVWQALSDGTYFVQIKHWNPNVGGCGTTYDLSVTSLVFNTAPAVEAGDDQVVNEGDTVSLAPATFTDPDTGDTHTATIDWGDGIVEPGTVDQEQGTVSGSHVFADSGVLTVTVTVTDDKGGSGSDTFTVTVKAACTLNLNASYTDGTLSMSLTIGTTGWTSFDLWLVSPGRVVPLAKGVSLPPIDPAITVSPSFPFPSMGTIGFLAILSEPDGIICWDFAIVDTGSPSASAAPSAEKLKGLFRKLGELLPKDE